MTSALLVFGTVFLGAMDSKLFNFLVIGSGDVDEDGDWVDVEMREQQQNKDPESSKTEYSNMDNLEADELQTPKEAAAASDVVVA